MPPTYWHDAQWNKYFIHGHVEFFSRTFNYPLIGLMRHEPIDVVLDRLFATKASFMTEPNFDTAC